MNSPNYLMNHILYHIFQNDLNIYWKNREKIIYNKNLKKKISVNKIENRIRFKIKTGYYLKLLTLETMKLLRSTKSKRNKDENGENVSHLEST